MMSLLFGIIMLIFMFPLLFIFGNAMMDPEEISFRYAALWSDYGGKTHFGLIPALFSLSSWKQLYTAHIELLFAFRNSLIIAIPPLLGIWLIAPLAGFALSKLQFPGSRILLGMYVLMALLPYQTMLVPNYIMISRLNLLGSYASVWLVSLFHPLPVFICYRWIKTIPNSFLESAAIDGAGVLRSYAYIILPLSKPAAAGALIISAADLWGMIEQPQVFLTSKLKYPLSLMLSGLEKENAGVLFACSVLFSIPILLFFMTHREAFLQSTQNLVIGKSHFER